MTEEVPRTSAGAVKAPFPWYGGKSRHAAEVNQRLGSDLDVYVEPFAGSLAVLLQRTPSVREVVCDKNGFICNFWRSVQAAPGEVAKWADWPVLHQDLTARHRYLVEWQKHASVRLSDDPDFFDAKMAGWWVWGQNNSIAASWCLDNGRSSGDTRPQTGSGRTAQKLVSLSAQGQSLYPWMRALADRLRGVTVLNRDWSSACTDSVLKRVPSRSVLRQGVFFDPPYLTHNRHVGLYTDDEKADVSAFAAWEWAVENGDSVRVAYCAGEGSFDLPAGWTESRFSISSGKKTDVVLFSPACLGRGDLF